MSAKKQSFIKGAAILAIAGIVSKALGAVYRIPLGNIIPSEGMAYYQTAYDLYVWALTLSSYSIPIAISKLVSERIELGRRDEAHKIFKVAFVLIAFLGIALATVVFFNAQAFAEGLRNPNAFVAILCVSPAIFIVSLSAAFRGYFQGMQNMTPSAVSQVSEQIGRVIFGFILAIILLPYGYKIAAGGAIFGTTVGSAVGLATLIYIYTRNKRDIKESIRPARTSHMESALSIAKRIIVFAIPITIGGSIMPVMGLLDTFIVMDRLQAAGYTQVMAASLFGQLKAMAGSFINLPQVFTIALGASLVPTISESIARNDMRAVGQKSQLAIRISLLVGLPAALGLFTLADPIMRMIYPKEPDTLGMALRYMAPSVIFLTLVQTMTGILQGMGKERVPVVNMVIGAIAKVIVSYILTSIPWFNIRGAALGTVVGYGVSAFLNLQAVVKYQKGALNVWKILVKPCIATLFMSITAYSSYRLIFLYTMRNSIATLASIMLAALVYCVVLLVIKGITLEEIEMAPGGKRLSVALKKKGLL